MRLTGAKCSSRLDRSERRSGAMSQANLVESLKPAGHKWKRQGLAVVCLLVLGMIGWVALGKSRRGQVGHAVQSVTDGVESASSTMQDMVGGVRTSVVNLGLVQAVEASLHTDKSLDADAIKVS